MGNLKLLLEKNVVAIGAGIVVAGIILTAMRVDIGKEQPVSASVDVDWHSRSFTPTTSLEAPAVLEDAVIWHPAGESVLIYEPMDRDSDSIRYEWVVGIPRDWLVVAANDTGDQHLVWLNTEGRLWRSEINRNGQQILAAIGVGGFNVVDFGAGSLSNGLTLIWWQALNGINKSVFVLLVDQWGRPLDERLLLEDSDQFALATSQSGQVYLAWTMSSSTDEHRLHAIEISATELMGVADIRAQAVNLAISTGVGEWIDSLAIVVSLSEISVIWGIMSIESPDHSDFHGVVWEHGSVGEEPTRFKVEIGNAGTKLRWMGRLTSPQTESTTMVALTAFLDSEWRAVLVEMNNGDVTSYEVISILPANASAPHVWIGEEGHISAAWARVQQKDIVHQIVSNHADLERSQPSTVLEDQLSFGEVGLKWFLSLPYGVLWLVLPMAILAGFGKNYVNAPSWQVLLILGLYWLGKSLVHGEVLNTPPSFEYTDSETVRVGVALGSGVLVAGAIAQRIRSMGTSWRTILVVFLVGDVVMTYLIFGANLA